MNWSLLLPGYLVTGLAFGVFTLDLIVPRLSRTILSYLGALFLVVVGVIVWITYPESTQTFGDGLLHFDTYTKFFFILFIGLGAFTVLASTHYVSKIDSPGEFYALLILSVVGAMGMAAAGELITAYISLELLSFSLYILASYSWQERRTNESGTKYILLGAVASAFLLLGISYLYGLTGTTRYDLIASELAVMDINPGIVIALTLVTAGLGFKVAAVPFHMWTPDVYEGAPIPVTAYIASLSKAAGFALLLRLVVLAFSPLVLFWDWVFLLLAVLSMVLGNVVAIVQTNIKRLMAYSSIGQVGYLMLGIAALSAPDPTKPAAGILIHIVSYAVSTLAAFFVILAVYNQTGKEKVSDFAGLAKRSPFLAMVLTVALFSLAGFPFFIGFSSKFYLFTVIATGGTRFLLAVSVAILASLVSLYYYLNIVRQMYIEEPEDNEEARAPVHVPHTTRFVLIFIIGVIVLGGIYILPLAQFAESGAASLFTDR